LKRSKHKGKKENTKFTKENSKKYVVFHSEKTFVSFVVKPRI